MSVEILNLGKKRYVESLFLRGKSHLLRNVIDIKSYSISIAIMTCKCFSCFFENDRIRNSIPWL